MTIRKNTFQICFFAACCLFLSALEYAVPKPLPFMRLGLANLPVLLSVKKMRPRDTLLLILCKVIGQSLIGGTTFSYIFLFSSAGSIASGFAIILMYRLFRKKNAISNIGLSLAGALANNGAQLLCARYVMFGENVRYIAPLLLVSGLVTGLLLGVFANQFEHDSHWFSDCCMLHDDAEYYDIPDACSEGKTAGAVQALCAFAAMLAMLFVKSIVILWMIVLLFFIIDEIQRKGKMHLLPPLCIVLSVTFFSLLSPYGKVLFSIGAWRITSGALIAGLHRSGVLVGMVFVSQFLVHRDMMLPGKTGALFSCVIRIFEQLVSSGKTERNPSERVSSGRFSLRNIIGVIDARLTDIFSSFTQHA